MKTQLNSILVLFFIFCTSTFTTSAKIWRVNNRENIKADFKMLQEAHDGANAGDTLYLEPSPTSYGDLTLTKRLIIIGTGYFLDQNPETQWKNNWPATVGTVTFANTPTPNCEHSQMMGVTCTGSLNINESNINIKRNYFLSNIYISQVSEDSITNINFCQNFCGYTNTTSDFYMRGALHDIIIKNNIFDYNWYGWTFQINGTVAYNGVFKNNTIIGYKSYWYYDTEIINIENFTFQNNILLDCNFSPNNNIFSNNISNNGTVGELNGDQSNIDPLFIGPLNPNGHTIDNQVQLQRESPAIGAGILGVDCGAFGGPEPYVLSGMPPIPAIYDYMIGSTGGQFNLNIKAKSHK